jgi:stage II sporulation protein AA (anti-sigma F factor antagonist)
MQAFTLTEKDVRPGCRQIDVAGELDLAVAEQLQTALQRAAADHDQVLISLQACEFIDSTGIATILQAHSRMAEEGRRLAVFGAQGQVERILGITGLSANGLVFATADEALATDTDADADG